VVVQARQFEDVGRVGAAQVGADHFIAESEGVDDLCHIAAERDDARAVTSRLPSGGTG
jgi:high-affinity K+ transport system ATPase subunit B